MENTCIYDLIWSTCRASAVLVGRVGERTRELLIQAAEANGWRVLELSIEPAQVAIRVAADPQVSPHILARALKAATSPVLRDEFPELRKLPSLWTREYAATTVSPKFD